MTCLLKLMSIQNSTQEPSTKVNFPHISVRYPGTEVIEVTYLSGICYSDGKHTGEWVTWQVHQAFWLESLRIFLCLKWHPKYHGITKWLSRNPQSCSSHEICEDDMVTVGKQTPRHLGVRKFLMTQKGADRGWKTLLKVCGNSGKMEGPS